MYTFLKKAYLRGQFIDFNDANISIATHALHYGTGAFGGLRAYVRDGKTVLFKLDEHSKRLSNSAKYLGFDLKSDKIKQTIIDFVKINNINTSSYIRPLVYTSDLGIAPKLHDLEKDFLIYGIELGDYLPSDKLITACFSSWIRQDDASFPLRGKITGGYITSALAKTEAVNRGFDEGIFLNSNKKVCEATGMNIFIVRDNTLITNGVNSNILEGITRKTVLEIAEEIGIKTEIRDIDKTELIIAEEVFLCGTAAKITGVRKIEQYELPSNNPITKKLQKRFKDIVEGNIDKSDKFYNKLTLI